MNMKNKEKNSQTKIFGWLRRILPAGKSGHLELGYFIGSGKRGYILLNGEPERFDVMYKFATKVCNNKEELLMELHGQKATQA